MNWQRIQTSASIALLRTLLICVNIIFLISGGILFLIGIVLRGQITSFLELTPESSLSAPFILLGLGLIIFFIGLFAFWCTVKGHVSLLYLYSIVVFAVFLSEILLAVTVLIKKQEYEDSFKTTLTRVLSNYPKEPMASNIDNLQKKLACCGIDKYEDWFGTSFANGTNRVPESCCKMKLNHPCDHKDLKRDYLPADINVEGCYATVLIAVQSNYPVFAGIIIAIALFPLIAVFLSCCLARQMRQQRYEQVD